MADGLEDEMHDFDCEDIFGLLADTGNAEVASLDGQGPSPSAELDADLVPACLPPLPGSEDVVPLRSAVMVETVLLADVQALGTDRFNSLNHHEWAPFRAGATDAEGVVVDPTWWASLSEPVVAGIQAAVAEKVEVASAPIATPHTAEILHEASCMNVYHAYCDGFAFARWRHLRPEARIIPLKGSDRCSLEEICRRRVLGGSTIKEEDLEELSPDLLQNLNDAIDSVGGQAFAKTAEKSAKNDVKVRPHANAKSVLEEITASKDVLQQSLGSGVHSRRCTARYLVIQPWDSRVSRANEFRVIVASRQVVGITQQSWAHFVGHTIASAQSVVEPLLHLWYDELLPTSPYADCILDAFVDNGTARLIEVNPCGFWGSSGGGLFHYLFDREALLDVLQGGPLHVRVVVETAGPETLDPRIAMCQHATSL